MGVDGSPSSMAALEWAAQQAELAGSTLVVVTTWEWPNLGWGLGSPPLPEDYHPATGAQTMLDGALGTVRGAHPVLAIRSALTEGHPAQVPIDAARGADLLVVGCRGHGGFSGMLLGSVSTHCIAHAHCPVVVIHEHPSNGKEASTGDTGDRC